MKNTMSKTRTTALVGGFLCLLATMPAGAAIVTINLTSAGTGGIDITGVNAGMSWEQQGRKRVSGFVPGGTLDIYCGFSSVSSSPTRLLGLDAGDDLQFAVGLSNTSPVRFTPGAVVGSSNPTYSASNTRSTFYYSNTDPNSLALSNSASFGANSFMGFRFGSSGSYRYGYIEVLWSWTGDPATSTFQLLSAAYEDQLNTAITIPSPVAVPGAGLASLATVGLAGLARRRRR